VFAAVGLQMALMSFANALPIEWLTVQTMGSEMPERVSAPSDQCRCPKIQGFASSLLTLNDFVVKIKMNNYYQDR